MSVTKRELEAIVHAGGLSTDGKETLADLEEAITFLAQAWRVPLQRAETAEILADDEVMAALKEGEITLRPMTPEEVAALDAADTGWQESA